MLSVGMGAHNKKGMAAYGGLQPWNEAYIWSTYIDLRIPYPAKMTKSHS